MIFVYDKSDQADTQTAILNILHTVLIHEHRTADYQITRAIREILERDGNRDDLMAVMFDKNLPVDEIAAGAIADEILQSPPSQGYLTISNALQWRLQYARVIEQAGQVEGIEKVV